MFAVTGKSRFQGFTTGSQAFGGTVYKTWNDGKNGLIVLNQDWDVPEGGGTLTRFQNGFCTSNPTTSTSDGLANTKILRDLSSGEASSCYFTAAADAWIYTRENFSEWEHNDGYGDWWIPAYDEMNELYSSSLMPNSPVGPYITSTDAGTVGGDTVGWGLNFSTGVWAKYGDSGTEDVRIRLIREY